MKYIYHHLGLGDHIICNGLVRSLINEHNKYTMFVKSHNRKTVEFMYRDIKNLSYLEGDDQFVHKYLTDNNVKSDDLIVAGFYNHPNTKEFDESFYLQNNLPFSYRWDKFKVIRNLEREKELFYKYNITENKYVFIHDDHVRGLYIDERFVNNINVPIVRPINGFTDNIFDYMYLMEHSLESHFMDSSFRLVYDSLGPQKDYLFYHVSYDKIKRDSTKSQSKLNYKIV